MLDLDFENGFWVPDTWVDDDERGVITMWRNFRSYCYEKDKNMDKLDVDATLFYDFNATAQRFAGDDDGDDEQWFIKFKTREDYTYFVMRFA